MDKKETKKVCSLYFDLSDNAVRRIKDYCGMKQRITLNFREQKFLFGVSIFNDLRPVTIYVDKWGITFLSTENELTTSFTWHGLIGLIIGRLVDQEAEVRIK